MTLTFEAAFGQTMETTIDKLIKLEIIDKNQKEDIAEILQRNQGISNSTVFLALENAEMVRIIGRKNVGVYTIFSFENEKQNDNEQDKINSELQNFLSKLKEGGFLGQKVYELFKYKIDSDEFLNKLQLISQLKNQTSYSEWLNPENLIPFSDKLYQNKILTDSNFKQLQDDIRKGKIESQYQLVSYCKNSRFFDLSKYSNDPAIYLEGIHKEVSQILTELSFTDFNYKIEVDSDESFSDYTEYKVVVSLKCNGKGFKQKSFISPDDIGKNNNYLGKIGAQEFYQIFNKVLCDLQSPFRLHQIKPNNQFGESTDFRYFGIIALRKEQTEMFHDLNTYIEISYENFKNKLTSKHIDKAISEYQKIGLLNHLTTEQIKNEMEKAYQKRNNNLNDVLACFPSVIHLFDTELSNLENPYAELLEEFANISHGTFNPVEISDDFNLVKNKVTIKFTLSNKKYVKNFVVQRDWIDPLFFEFIKQVVIENKLNGQFYELLEDGQASNIIYLTNEQYQYLRANKLLAFSSDWEAEEE